MADRRIHIAGHGIQIGTKYRQRCAWCDYILIDGDLSCEASAPGCDPHRARFFGQGELVEVVKDGGVTGTTIVPHKDREQLPPGTCASPPRKLEVVRG